MDRLKQQASIAKMSEVRLRQKLEEAGFKADDIAEWERKDLLAAWADLEAETMPPGVEGAVAMELRKETEREELETYNWSVEERRLMLEERRLVEQRLQREQEEMRWRRE